MTSLIKAVRLKTRATYSVLYSGLGRPIVVSLEPGDVITFREPGRRQTWSVPIERMFRQAVRESAQVSRHEKRRQKRAG